jgi:glutathione-regulated potassium-efflux system protein KefB
LVLLALSSTAFVLQLLTENNAQYHLWSAIFFNFTFQDIAAIPLLAVIPLLAGTESTHHGIAYFAAIIATFTGCSYLVVMSCVHFSVCRQKWCD